jgi:hypothetical protein
MPARMPTEQDDTITRDPTTRSIELTAHERFMLRGALTAYKKDYFAQRVRLGDGKEAEHREKIAEIDELAFRLRESI